MPPKTKGILKKSGRRIDRKNGEANNNNTASTTRNNVRFSKVANEGFTKEEIQQILNKHKEIVEDMNKHLPKNQQVSIDKDLEKKLQDPKIAKMYHIGREIKEKERKQLQIHEALRDKYGSPKTKVQGFYIFDSFRTGDTEEDRIYNETLYRNYKDNPLKYAYNEYSKVLKTSSKELYDLGDDPIKQGEYYLKNFEKCNYANSLGRFAGAKENEGLVSEGLKKNAESIGGLGNFLMQTKYGVKNYDSIEKLAFPKLNPEQAENLYFQSYGYKINQNEDIRDCVSDAHHYGGPKENPSPKQYFDMLKEKTGVDLSNTENFMTSKVFYDDKGKPMNVNNMFFKYLDNDKFGEAKDITDPNEIRDIEFITTDFKNRYLGNWQKRFNEKMGINSNKLDIKSIEEKNKGNWLHRTFRRPSKEYAEMMNAFKDYHNPNSKDYMNDQKLNEKTQAYVDHKNASGKEISGADKVRMDFAKSILDTNKDKDKILNQTKSAYIEHPTKRVTFLLPEEVNVENAPKQKENVVENVKEAPAKSEEKEQDIELSQVIHY